MTRREKSVLLKIRMDKARERFENMTEKEQKEVYSQLAKLKDKVELVKKIKWWSKVTESELVAVRKLKNPHLTFID